MSRLILASQSPRRREIFDSLRLDYSVEVSDINEDLWEGETPQQYVQRLAMEKARAVANRSGGVVVGADTIVVLDETLEILGKPASRVEAESMLLKLSGRWHTVFTGVAVVANAGTEVDYACTRVRFASFTRAELDWYLDSSEPYDKAGAYAIQGYGSLFVEEIQGNYLTVVGLPVPLLKRLFTRLGLEHMLLAGLKTVS